MNNKLLIFILLLGLFLRLYSIKNNNIFFYFDQARDATISRQIIEQKDLKIMGPSVSGTDDSIYHGVLYYYLIGPIYSFSNGDPYAVAVFLSIIGVLSIFITYKLGALVFNSKTTGLIAAFLQAISIISIHQSTWLSNPSLSALFVPLSYLLFWQIFFTNKKQTTKQYIFLGLSLALAMQSALQNIVLLGSLLIFFIFAFFKNKKFNFNIKNYLYLSIAFLTGISTMILTEFLMFKRGILSFNSLNLEEHSVDISLVLQKIAEKYLAIFSDILDPSKKIAFFILIIYLIIIYFSKINKKQIIWSLSFIFAPVWLLFWHYRDPNHTFIGLETVIFLTLAHGLSKLLKQNLFNKIFVFIFIFIILILNINTLKNWKNQQFQYYGIQKGAFLNNQLNLIDKTYELANKKSFSFSSLTSPYMINTTWNYLYKWHGQNKYDYLPNFVGNDQRGFVGTDLLTESLIPSETHFLIYEPDTTLSTDLENKFLIKQEQLFNNKFEKTEFSFGTLKLVNLNIL